MILRHMDFIILSWKTNGKNMKECKMKLNKISSSDYTGNGQLELHLIVYAYKFKSEALLWLILNLIWRLILYQGSFLSDQMKIVIPILCFMISN